VVWASQSLGFGWPSEAVELRGELRSPDVEIRRRAAGELTSLSPRLAAKLVAHALLDQDRTVRLTAADAAVVLQVQPESAHLEAWLSDRDIEVRRAGLRVLCQRPKSDQLDGILRAVVDQNVEVRLLAVGCLARIDPADDHRVETPLAMALDDAEERVRALAAETVGRLVLSHLSLPLAAKLQDADPSVRTRAAVALGVLGRDEGVPALTLALGDSSPEVAQTSARSLGRLRAVASVPALLSLVDREPWDALSAVAAEALAEIGSEKAVDALVADLGRSAAQQDLVLALGRAEGKAQVARSEALLRCLRVATGGQLLGCLRASSRWGISLAPVVPRLTSGEVPAAAVLASLDQVTDPDLLILALERLELGGDSERKMILELLEHSAPLPEFVTGPLSESLGAPGWSSGQRARLLSLLARLQGEEGLDAARPFLKSSQPALRAAAASVVAAHSDDVDEVLDVLQAEPLTQELAVSALARGMSPTLAEQLIAHLRSQGGVSVSPVARALEGAFELSPAAQDDLVALLPQARGEVRDLLLELLARQSTLARLRPLMDHGGRLDRRRLVGTLAFRASPPQDFLLRALGDEDQWVRVLAVQGLDSLERLSSLASDRTETGVVRTAAMLRLSDLGKAPPAGCALDVSLPFGERAVGILASTEQQPRCDANPGALLRGARDPVLRFFAARALFRKQPDASALRACRVYEMDGTVARACGGEPPAGSGEGGPSAFVRRNGEPRVGVPFARWSETGRITLGISDRRGRLMGPGLDGAAVLLDPRLAL
jgi:HEAT repeat protein